MATYCYRCPVCGATEQLQTREHAVGCADGHGLALMRRDYRSEAVGVAVAQLKSEREAGGTKEYDSLFLPTNREFAGPGDPDGTKGMREWRDTHQPKAGNKNPRWPGEVDKKVW